MFYFDLRPALKCLNDEQTGRLFNAMLDYGERGEEPSFEDPLLGMAWAFVKPGIDRDALAYDNKIEQRRYAGYSSAAKKKNVTPISFEEWKELSEAERQSLLMG